MMEHHQACSRYQVLQNEDDSPQTTDALQPNLPTESPPTLPPETDVPPEIDIPPPPYSSVTIGATASATETDFQSDLMPVPPPYSVATSLPTYDEAEKAKAAAMAAGAAEAGQRFREPRNLFDEILQGTSQVQFYPASMTMECLHYMFKMWFVHFPNWMLYTILCLCVMLSYFICNYNYQGCFLLQIYPFIRLILAFLFNWIGFCLSFCLTNTIAGRYGAICGFGLSLIKWILIVRFSDYFNGYFNGQYWLWWIFLVLGLLLFFRGFINYLKIRNMSENMAAAHRTRFFFLY
uniref:NEDD4 family-interacting protein 2-like n=1 Tax=Pristiophorus japonicus TaxID=55135 RepID=UPI00398EDF5B